MQTSATAQIGLIIRPHASLCKKATIHQVTTSKKVLLPGYNHLLTTGADDVHHLIITLTDARAMIKVKGNPYRWLAGGYDLEIGHF